MPPEPDMIEIVVVGAHLSGMPLNGDLVKLGGVFRRAAVTTSAYKLFALAGGPPKRPGLLRLEAGLTGGAAIETEVWAMPAEGFGRFVASIPQPLCIGTVLLADGSTPKGFLVEPAGLAGATEITGHGGWRAYVTALTSSAA